MPDESPDDKIQALTRRVEELEKIVKQLRIDLDNCPEKTIREFTDNVANEEARRGF